MSHMICFLKKISNWSFRNVFSKFYWVETLKRTMIAFGENLWCFRKKIFEFRNRQGRGSMRGDDGSNKNGSNENGSNSGLPTYFREVKID